MNRVARTAFVVLCVTIPFALPNARGGIFELTPIREIPGMGEYSERIRPDISELSVVPSSTTQQRIAISCRFPRLGYLEGTVTYESPEDIVQGKWRMALDTNRDGDLGNDPVVAPDPKTGIGWFDIADHWGRSRRYGFRICLPWWEEYLSGGGSLPASETERSCYLETQGYPRALYRGWLEMDGKRRMAVLIDWQGNGFAGRNSRPDRMFVDADGDGRITPPGAGPYDLWEGEVELETETPTILGRVWRRKIDDSGPSITLEPYDGAVGKVVFRNATGGAVRMRPRALAVYNRSGSTLSSTVSFDGGLSAIELPVATHALAYAMVDILGPPGTADATLLIGREDGFEVVKGRPNEIVLREIPRLRPVVTSVDIGVIHVDWDITGLEGAPIEWIHGPEGPAKASLRVFHGEPASGTLLTTATSSSRGLWPGVWPHIPHDLPLGSKLCVEARMDTKTWLGVLEGRAIVEVDDKMCLPAYARPVPKGASDEENEARRRIGQVLVDLRSLRHAVECYSVDNSWYPPRLTPFLTSPVAYVERIPVDPFSPNRTPIQYERIHHYLDWLFYSVGPDGVSQKGRVAYDPTNGTISGGDVIRRKRQRAEQNAP